MPVATVLIPTFKHAETLRHSVASVQAQTVQDFELFLVADGASTETRAVAAELAAGDDRIHVFDLPKGPNKGEIHRHAALAHATGRIVSYLGDDDLWMPHHLATLRALLADADFGHTLHIGIGPDGALLPLAADLERPGFRQRMLNTQFNAFDMTFAGHTLAAYRRLPHGWRTTPPDMPWADLYMWRQFLSQPWCRARSWMVPTGLCTWSSQRPHLTNRQRAAEMARWRDKFSKPNFRESLWRVVARKFASDAIVSDLQARSATAKLADAQAKLRKQE